MDVKKFMDKDLHFLETSIKELSDNSTHWDTDKVFEKSRELFDHFSRRFALEDFMLCRLKSNVNLKPGIEKFLKKRLEYRAILECILNLHADEPDFRTQICALLEKIRKHMTYRETEFYPDVINRLSESEYKRVSEALEEGLIIGVPIK